MTEYPVSTDEELAQAVSHINAAETGAKIKLVLGADVNLTQSIKPQNAIDLEVCSAEDEHYTITAKIGSGDAAIDMEELDSSKLTLRDIAIELDAASFNGWAAIASGGIIDLNDCTLNGNKAGDGVSGVVLIFQYASNDRLKIQNSTIQEFSGIGISTVSLNVEDRVATVETMFMENTTIQGCGDGGLYVDEGTMARIKSGCVITDCSAGYGGGVQLVGDGSVLIIEEGTKIYGNTATEMGDDIWIRNSKATLVNAAAMKATAKDGHTIDGWYLDNENARYDRTAHAEPVSGTITANSETGDIGLVASYGVYDIAFDGENAADCTAYSDNDCTKAITAAAPGDKVYLKYTGALKDDLTAEQCIGWDAATGDDTAVPVYAYDPGYFVMPAKPAGNKVTLTPKVMNIADAIEEPAAPADGGAGGAIAAVAIGAAAAVGVYEAGTGIYRMVNMKDIPMPGSRGELAALLWEHAGRPEPQSTALYADIDAADTDLQKAARWCIEQGLLTEKADNTFKPGTHVTKLRVCITWDKAKQQGLFDQAQ